MGSIRPLFTITVLVVVGAYLYVKINEGPARPHAHSHDGHDHGDDGIPPLAAAGSGATLAQDTTAPAWPPAESKTSPAMPPLASTPALPAANGAAPIAPATNNASTSSDATKNALPEVPPIPELPEMPQTADATPPAAQPGQPAATPPLTLPTNIPTAQYDNDAGPNLGGGATGDMPGALPALPTLPGETASAATQPGFPATAPTSSIPPAPNATNVLPITPGSDAGAVGTTPLMPSSNDRYGQPITSPAATTAPPTPAMPAINSTAPGAPAIPAIPAGVQIPDRYGVGASVTPQPPAVTPLAGGAGAAAGASFAASWPTIQAALDKRDLKQAHQLLSKWHGDETLAPADAQKVESLLGQLAGTVIYSTEHQLEPARVVKPGETLDAIAKEYNVPWQLLAKINSIPAPDQVRPGQQLKVLRGPFSAVVDLQRSEMTLEVGGYYAGTFPIQITPGTEPPSGNWIVQQRLESESSTGQLAGATAPARFAAEVQQLMLQNAAPAAGQPAIPVVIGSRPAISAGAAAGASPATAQQFFVQVSQEDIVEIADILSIGSRVTVRR